MASQRLTMDITDVNKATEYVSHPTPNFEEPIAVAPISELSQKNNLAFTRTALVFKDRLDRIRNNKAHDDAGAASSTLRLEKRSLSKVDEIVEVKSTFSASSSVWQLDRRVRILRIVQHGLTSTTCVIIAVLQSLTYIKYEQTKDIPGAWPQNPTLGPTLLLLAVASMAVAFDVCSLVTYLLAGRPIAERAYRLAISLHYWITSLKTFAYTIAASVCRAGFSMGGTQDLWGWSCSAQGQQMAATNAAHINCTGNTVAWLLSIINVATEVLGILITHLMTERGAKGVATPTPATNNSPNPTTENSASNPLLVQYSDLEPLGDVVQGQLKDQSLTARV